MPSIALVNKPSGGRKGGTKVRTGCRTCKIRKVKCDEGRPACYRCVSTGRKCEGYGIWGSGGTTCDTIPLHHVNRISAPTKAVAISPTVSAVTALPANAVDRSHFEWFKSRTASKLSGSFLSSFWTSLVIQASLNEPAIMHAALTLSSVHKRGTVDPERLDTTDKAKVEDQEQFAMQHYVRAIKELQPHLSTGSRSSCRVALIACVIFVSIEFLRGHFETAQTHLKNGLKILEDMKAVSSRHEGILHPEDTLDPAEDWIVEAFARLNLQVELFKHGHQHSCQVVCVAGKAGMMAEMYSLKDAWKLLEILLNSVFYVSHLAHKQATLGADSYHDVHEKQRLIKMALASWHDKYHRLMADMDDQVSIREARGYYLLCAYHTMASIMVATCLQSGDETAFDHYTDKFILLLKQCIRLFDRIFHFWPTATYTTRGCCREPDFAGPIVDMGWIPLLYYAATKCRVHRIRLQAIRLLESTPHREGIWDAGMAACVARKVMELEEGNFYQHYDLSDDFLITSMPQPQDFLLPNLPEAYRIREVEVVLSGSPVDKILLFSTLSNQGAVHSRHLLAQFDVHQQQWLNTQIR